MYKFNLTQALRGHEVRTADGTKIKDISYANGLVTMLVKTTHHTRTVKQMENDGVYMPHNQVEYDAYELYKTMNAGAVPSLAKLKETEKFNKYIAAIVRGYGKTGPLKMVLEEVVAGFDAACLYLDTVDVCPECFKVIKKRADEALKEVKER